MLVHFFFLSFIRRYFCPTGFRRRSYPRMFPSAISRSPARFDRARGGPRLGGRPNVNPEPGRGARGHLRKCTRTHTHFIQTWDYKCVCVCVERRVLGEKKWFFPVLPPEDRRRWRGSGGAYTACAA